MIDNYANGLEQQVINEETIKEAHDEAELVKEKKAQTKIELVDNKTRLQEAFKGLSSSEDMQKALEETVPLLNDNFDTNSEEFYKNQLEIQKYKDKISKTKDKETIASVDNGAVEIIDKNTIVGSNADERGQITIDGETTYFDDENVQDVVDTVKLNGISKEAYIRAGGSEKTFNKKVDNALLNKVKSDILSVPVHKADGSVNDAVTLAARYQSVYDNLTDNKSKEKLDKVILDAAKGNVNQVTFENNVKTALRDGLGNLVINGAKPKDVKKADLTAQRFILNRTDENGTASKDNYSLLGNYFAKNPTANKSYINGFASKTLANGVYDNEADFNSTRDYVNHGGELPKSSMDRFNKISAYMSSMGLSYGEAKQKMESQELINNNRKMSQSTITAEGKKALNDTYKIYNNYVNSGDLSEEEARIATKYHSVITDEVGNMVAHEPELQYMTQSLIQDRVHNYMDKLDPDTGIDTSLDKELVDYHGKSAVAQGIKSGLVDYAQQHGYPINQDTNIEVHYHNDGTVTMMPRNGDGSVVGSLKLSKAEYNSACAVGLESLNTEYINSVVDENDNSTDFTLKSLSYGATNPGQESAGLSFWDRVRAAQDAVDNE